jgi:malonate-semialdehyde dehydrogenase (acetylating)/methylmalonate-semialdehyde dehydrogenase
MILAQLAQEAGVPDGVLQIIHGAAPTVNALLDAPEVKALSFVGGDKAGTYVHQRGTHQGKRIQSNMQAKNHCVSPFYSLCVVD